MWNGERHSARRCEMRTRWRWRKKNPKHRSNEKLSLNFIYVFHWLLRSQSSAIWVRYHLAAASFLSFFFALLFFSSTSFSYLFHGHSDRRPTKIWRRRRLVFNSTLQQEAFPCVNFPLFLFDFLPCRDSSAHASIVLPIVSLYSHSILCVTRWHNLILPFTFIFVCRWNVCLSRLFAPVAVVAVDVALVSHCTRRTNDKRLHHTTVATSTNAVRCWWWWWWWRWLPTTKKTK